MVTIPNPGGNSKQRKRWRKAMARMFGELMASGESTQVPIAAKKSIWQLVWSWPVVGTISPFVLAGGIAFMTSGHPYLAYLFYVLGTLLLAVKLVTWEEARQHKRKKLILVGGVILFAGVAILACYGTYRLNAPQASTVAKATISEQGAFVDARVGQAVISLGGTMALTRKFSDFRDGYDEPFAFWGFKPIRLHLDKGVLYCNIQMWRGKGRQGIQIADGKFTVYPSEWDWNYSDNEFEVADENRAPVLQVIRKRPNIFQIYGLLVLPGGIVIANRSSTEAIPWSGISTLPSVALSPIFKYPSQRFLGKYSESKQ